MKKTKLLSLVSATAIGTSLVAFGGINANANSDTIPSNIQGAYYYINGIEYEVPKSQIINFISNDTVTELPTNPPEKLNSQKSQKVAPRAGCSGEEGWVFDAKRTASGFKLGNSGSRVINDTPDPLTEVSLLSTDTQVNGKLSGKSKVNWGVIEGEVGFEIGGSVTWKTQESTTITVRPGYWGWIDYGAYTETWEGDYYYVTSTCNIKDSAKIKVMGPKYKAKMARSEPFRNR